MGSDVVYRNSRALMGPGSSKATAIRGENSKKGFSANKCCSREMIRLNYSFILRGG